MHGICKRVEDGGNGICPFIFCFLFKVEGFKIGILKKIFPIQECVCYSFDAYVMWG